MEKYREGYELYREACKHYGIESLDFHFFVSQLTQDQLNAFNSEI